MKAIINFEFSTTSSDISDVIQNWKKTSLIEIYYLYKELLKENKFGRLKKNPFTFTLQGLSEFKVINRFFAICILLL